MAGGIIPDAYRGREQAWIKHQVLAQYLERLFMIIGQRYPVINYVDCYAGPWMSSEEDLSDTSVGIVLKHARKCRRAIRDGFGKNVDFRLLFIERDEGRFRELHEFVKLNQHHPGITLKCINGDFVDKRDEIIRWARDRFTFYFIDPKGYSEVGVSTLRPLLERPNCEFLINFMYEFYNRAANLESIKRLSEDLLGRVLSFDESDSAETRATKILKAYRENINDVYRGKTSFIPVLRPGKDRVLYYLTYLTRHPTGIAVFKEEAQKIEYIQRVTHQEKKLRKQIEAKGTLSLFPEDQVYEEHLCQTKVDDNRDTARAFLLNRLKESDLCIDEPMWSDFLEKTDLYPQDLNLGMKMLIDEDKVECYSPDGVAVILTRRTKNLIKPGNRETWRLKRV